MYRHLSVPILFCSSARRYEPHDCPLFIEKRLAHLTTRVAATSSTDHGALHSAAPPAAAGAGVVINNRQVGLLQLSRQVTTSWEKQPNISEPVWTFTILLMLVWNFVTHSECVPIQRCSRGGCGPEPDRREEERPAGRSCWGQRQWTDAAEQCRNYKKQEANAIFFKILERWVVNKI